MHGRELTFSLSPFALEVLGLEAARQRVTVDTLVRHALLYLLAERDAVRLSARVPRFARHADRDASVSASLELDAGEWARLERVAAAEDVPLRELVAHAVTLYMADSDSGRVAVRVLQDERRR